MSFGLCFWIIMLVWVVFGAVVAWPRGDARLNVPVAGGSLLLFILILLLGWKTFGAPLHN